MKVLVFGTFDGVHPGHEDFLWQAKELGDELHVVLARDDTVEEVKGRPPSRDENRRRKDVLDQPVVTEARLGYHDDKYRIVEEINPDIIALGYDQMAFVPRLEPELKTRGIEAKILRLEPYHPDQFKSSKIDKE